MTEIDELKKENQKVRKELDALKSELKSIRERIDDKKSLLHNYDSEAEFIVKQIKTIAYELFDKDSDSSKLDALKTSLSERRGFENNSRFELHWLIS